MSDIEKSGVNVVVSSVDIESQNKDEVIGVIISPSGKPIQITGDVDVAMKYAINNKEGHIELDEITSKRILRKIDMFLLPVLCLLYCFQFMDKLSNAYASVLGLRTDLKMVGDMYSWTGTSFYIGYLFFEFPASYLLQRFPVAKTVAAFIITWGVVLCCHALPQYAGFIALRTLLGMLESSITPAFTIITAQWYTQEEQFMRVACWFACNGFGTILGGAISYGLGENQESYTIRAWKLVFVVTGCLTIFLGIVVAIHIPDTPAQAWFLTNEEKSLVVERIRTNQQGFGNRHFKKHQFIEAVTDYKTWLIFFFGLASNIPNGGMTNFGNILLTEDLGYAPQQSLLMQMPAGAVEIVGCIGLAYISTLVNSRMLLAFIGTGFTVMAQCFLAFGKQPELRMAGYSLYALGPIGFICMLSVVASNVAGHTKKVTTNAIFLIGYCVGNLIGPQTFRAEQAPKYQGAKTTIVICGIISLVIIGAVWYAYIWENKKKDKINKADYPKFENQEFADLTDKENVDFRYQT
ncbi:allantoate permease [[Candida] anglica]|uniref:Allantoate permease n=1 Tax=[Candida] anglica TaxID=148631 RepID=A0ABP0EA83_9ASCO